MSWPTKEQSRFATNWDEAWGSDRDQISGGSSWFARGDKSAREVLAATNGDAYTSSERLRALADSPARVENKAAPTVEKRVEPARVDPVEPSPEPDAPKPAASVFAALADTAIKVAEDRAGIDTRFEGKYANAAAIAETWGDAHTRAMRMVRDGVEVTLPSGEVRAYKSVREAFELLHLDLKKHVRFRGELKAKRTATFAAHGFRVVPRD